MSATASPVRMTARQMCENLIIRMATLNQWGGAAVIEMRTPLFSMGFDKKTQKEKITRKMVLKTRDAEKKPNPFWNMVTDRPLVIKCTRMQVQVGFDWFRIMQAAQTEGGFTPDYSGGMQQTWRSETRFICVNVDGTEKKSIFFYRVEIDNETGEEKPFLMGKSKIYLACLTPKNPVVPTESYYEEICAEPGRNPKRFDKAALLPWLPLERDEEDVAESQGHPGRPDLNRNMFTPCIQNIVSLSAFGRKYILPKVRWDEVSPINFCDLPVEVLDYTEGGDKIAPGYSEPLKIVVR